MSRRVIKVRPETYERLQRCRGLMELAVGQPYTLGDTIDQLVLEYALRSNPPNVIALVGVDHGEEEKAKVLLRKKDKG